MSGVKCVGDKFKFSEFRTLLQCIEFSILLFGTITITTKYNQNTSPKVMGNHFHGGPEMVTKSALYKDFDTWKSAKI